MNYFSISAFSILLLSSGVWAQGCPPGQYQIGGQGAIACAPIPQGNPVEQPPRPSGKWIETWGAIAGDGNENLGVSTGKLKKADAQQDAVEKCEAESQKKCSVLYVYENRCAAIAEPEHRGYMIRGFAAGPSIEVASRNAISFCNQKNKEGQCKVIYTACTEPVFQKF
ncbi:hypothetical protein XaplCFBP3122_20810 [Xanthomonas arboricola pv. populi]|uniref:DUF4189 domain-containing protein n=1 Tax=Xanthomonas arboricola pv. populi TaxID=487823 RepID=A0A2S6YZA5_9XANT|nr:DUF4189 domain-containing protein [Xanthomonas arboricola]PPT73362.1 hypothetical protein XaplCFBP3122_20810 [Xanthomonas arboricola pv. populi]